ncbi:MAG: hypothetical protein LUC87_08015 [Clostridiales bacterium]|nr:hypothetical protein [Clostridiales bacterium]
METEKDLYVQGVEDAPAKEKRSAIVTVAVIVSLICVVLVIAQLFLPALMVGEQNTSGVFEYNTYSGIDVAFICWPEFILGGELIGPNPVLIAAIVLAVLAGLICSLIMLNAGAGKRKVLGVILAAVFAYFGIAWLNLGTLVMNTAYSKFTEIVYYAKQNDMYGLSTYAVVISIACLVAAALNIAVVVLSAKTKKNAEHGR